MILNIEKQDIDEVEKDLLAKQYEEEMMANELYMSFYEKYGVETFKNIATSEAKYMDVVKADANLIDRLFKNVIENAKKYGKKGEKIVINMDNNFSISNIINNEINNSHLDKIFNTFYKVDNSRSNEGYGLGLSIVQKIIDLHLLKLKVDIKTKNFTLYIYS